MAERDAPGKGPRPGLESQLTQAATGKPSQVPGVDGGPNADAFDASPEAEGLRPVPGDGPGDPRAGAGDLHEDPANADAPTVDEGR